MTKRLRDRRVLGAPDFEIHAQADRLLTPANERAIEKTHRRLLRMPKNSIVVANDEAIIGFATGHAKAGDFLNPIWVEIQEAYAAWGEDIPRGGLTAAINVAPNEVSLNSLAMYGIEIVLSTEELEERYRDWVLRDWPGPHKTLKRTDDDPRGEYVERYPRILIHRKWNLNRAKEREYTRRYGAP